jgi:beta-xylosidase
LLGEGQIVFHEPDRHHTIEGPKFLKRGGWYYILAPAGGVEIGWQAVLRSRDIYGPYEDRVVLEQGRTPINGPHQGAMVDTPKGEWWFLHFQDAGVYGRVVHLQPVEWRDDWPLMGELRDGRSVSEPVLHHRKPDLSSHRPAAPATSDEFGSSRLGLQWQWHANHRDDWHCLAARDGWLRLFAQPSGGDLSRTPNLLLQKFPARAFTAETCLDFAPTHAGQEAGLVVLGNSLAALALRATGPGTQIVLRVDGEERVLGEAPRAEVKLQLVVHDGGRCDFRILNGHDEARTLFEGFQARKGKWIGAKLGIYCIAPKDRATGGHADFDYFRFARV